MRDLGLAVSARAAELTDAHVHLRVVVVDAHHLVGYGIRLMLEAEADIRVVGEASTLREAVALVRRNTPDVVVLDPHLPGHDSAEVCKAMRTACPSAAMLLLSARPRQGELAEALRCRAAGHVPKETSPERLLRTLRAVADDEVVLDRDLAAIVLGEKRDEAPESGQPLSPRELEVVALMAEGLRNRDIAERMWIGETTVKTHVAHIIRKLGRPDRDGAVAEAIRQGILAVPSGPAR